MAEKKLEDRFVENVSRYPFYFITVLLGGLLGLIELVIDRYKKNTRSAVLVTVVVVLGFIFVTLTLKAMTAPA